MGLRNLEILSLKWKGIILFFLLLPFSHISYSQNQSLPSKALVIKGGYNLPLIRDPRWNHNLIGSEIAVAFEKYLDPSIALSSAISYGQSSFHGSNFLKKFKYSEPLIHAQRRNTQMGQFRLGLKLISEPLDKTYFNLGVGVYFIHMPDIDIYFQNGSEKIHGFNRVNPLAFVGVGKEIKILEKLSLIVEGNFRYLPNVKPGTNIQSIQEFNILTGIKLFL